MPKYLTYPHLPHLDALRGLAFLPVFFHHVFFTGSPVIQQHELFKAVWTSTRSGMLGLDFFFVLSAFLITYLLLFEASSTGKIFFGKFFARRCLRIWPLYFLMVAWGTISFAVGWNQSAPPSLLYFLSFTLNFYMAFNGIGFLFFLTVLWSIAVEEQFYVIWGSLMWAIVKITGGKQPIQGIVSFACAGIFISILFRYNFMEHNNQLFFNSLSVLSDFCVGIILGCLLKQNQLVQNFFRKLSPVFSMLIYLLLATFTIFYPYIFTGGFLLVTERLWFSILFAFVIGEQVYSERSFIKFSAIPGLNYAGKISLGLYFYHAVVITAASVLLPVWLLNDSLWEVLLLNPLLILLLTVGISVLSFELFEKRILAYKTRFYPSV